jgi:hypothetical protein
MRLAPFPSALRCCALCLPTRLLSAPVTRQQCALPTSGHFLRIHMWRIRTGSLCQLLPLAYASQHSLWQCISNILPLQSLQGRAYIRYARYALLTVLETPLHFNFNLGDNDI